MTNRRTLGLLVGLFVLLAVVTLIVQNLPQHPAVSTVTPFYNHVYPSLTVSDMQAVRIQDLANGNQLTITRSADGGWTSPDRQGTIDQGVADNIAFTIAVLPYTQTLSSPSTQDLENYGLRPTPSLLISAVAANGQQIAIAVGALTPPQTSYFAIIDDRPDVYILERAAIDYLIVQARPPSTATPLPTIALPTG